MLSYPAGVWYGYELPITWLKRSYSNPSWRSRTKEDRKFGAYEQPPAAALDHPKTPSTAFGSRSEYPLLLPSAKRLEQMPHAKCAATFIDHQDFLWIPFFLLIPNKNIDPKRPKFHL